MRRIKVSKGGVLRFQGQSDDFEFNRLYFFPKTKRSVAIEAAYNSAEEMDGVICWDYLQGYATGSGVYVVGETATLHAQPGPREEFDHWKIICGR